MAMSCGNEFYRSVMSCAYCHFLLFKPDTYGGGVVLHKCLTHFLLVIFPVFSNFMSLTSLKSSSLKGRILSNVPAPMQRDQCSFALMRPLWLPPHPPGSAVPERWIGLGPKLGGGGSGEPYFREPVRWRDSAFLPREGLSGLLTRRRGEIGRAKHGATSV